jgi:hypothetical protein
MRIDRGKVSLPMLVEESVCRDTCRPCRQPKCRLGLRLGAARLVEEIDVMRADVLTSGDQQRKPYELTLERGQVMRSSVSTL